MQASVTERQVTIIRAVVGEYVATGMPVGSQVLVDKYRLTFSSATVRKEMSILEQMGLLISPHTSAGRVPTDDAFRVYIDDFIQFYEEVLDTREILEDFYRSAQVQIDALLKSTAQMLAMSSNQLGIVLAPLATGSIIRRVELVSILDHQVLLVMVSSSGNVYQKKINLEKKVTQDDLYKIARFLNKNLPGHEILSLQNKGLEFLGDVAESLGNLAEPCLAIAQALVYTPPDQNVYLDGENNFARELLEIKKDESVGESVLNFVQNKAKICNLMNTLTSKENVSLQMGLDIDGHRVEGITVLVKGYSVGGASLGALGVIGINRMPYDRLIPAINYGAQMLSEVLSRRGEIDSELSSGVLTLNLLNSVNRLTKRSKGEI